MKVLIVDDKEENLVLLDTLLKGFGYVVEQASNGQEALNKLKNDSIQMVISDILMPVMDGYELCRICKTDPVLHHIIFVFYTATYTTKEDEAYALELGADQFLIKPMEPKAFLAAVRDVVQKAEKEKVSSKEPEISTSEALIKHRDRLLYKLNHKLEELESEIDNRRKAEEKYRTLMEFNPDTIIIHRGRKIVYVNRAGCKLLGADSAESLIGRKLFDFIHSDYHKIVNERVQKLLTGDPYAQLKEEKFVDVHGNVIEVEATTLPTIYDGKPAVQSLIRDIRERKTAEEALDQSEKQYKELIDGMNETVWVIDFNGNLVDVNQTAVDVLGYSKEELLKRGLCGIDPSLKKEDIQSPAKTMPSDTLHIFETSHRTKKGKTFPVEVYSSLVTYQGKPAILSIARDITKRRRAEEALKKSEHMLKVISENSRDIICLHDSKHKYVYVSPACKPLLGYEPEELTGTNPWDMVHPQDLKALQKEGPVKSNNGEPFLLSYRIRKKSGDYIWFESTSQTLRDEKGDITGFVTSSRDITERKRAEDLLREREEMIHSIVETSRDWIWAIDKDGRHTYSNPAVENILGYTPDELVGQSSIHLLKEEDRKYIESQLSKWIAEKKGWENLILRWKHKDGSWRWLESSSVPIVDAEGAFIGFRGVDRDITERRFAEDTIRNERTLLRTLIDHLPNGIFVKDRKFRKIIANPVHISEVKGHLKYLGMNPDIEILNRTDFEVFPKELAETYYKEDQKVIKDGRSIINNVEFSVQPDGEKIWLLVSKVPLFDTEGSIIGMVGITTDVSESKQAEAQIKNNLQEKEILLRELYHRTKNNMQVISSMLRLKARTVSNDDVKFIFREIENKILSMSLVHQKLYESKDLSSLNLKVYFNDLISLIRQSYLMSDDRIKLEYKAVDVPVLLDTAIPLGMVLNELMTNAVRHAFPEGRKGTIRIRLDKEPEKGIVLEVSDNGVGLPDGFQIEKDGRLGLETVLALAKQQLAAEVTFQSENGVRCRIVIQEELYRPRV